MTSKRMKSMSWRQKAYHKVKRFVKACVVTSQSTPRRQNYWSSYDQGSYTIIKDPWIYQVSNTILIRLRCKSYQWLCVFHFFGDLQLALDHDICIYLKYFSKMQISYPAITPDSLVAIGLHLANLSKCMESTSWRHKICHDVTLLVTSNMSNTILIRLRFKNMCIAFHHRPSIDQSFFGRVNNRLVSFLTDSPLGDWLQLVPTTANTTRSSKGTTSTGLGYRQGRPCLPVSLQKWRRPM